MDYNFIRVRVKDPKGFSKMRIRTLSERIRAVHGFSKDGTNEIQSVLFPKDQYTISQAKNWMVERGYQVQEVYLVNDIMLSKSGSHDITFIEEVYHGVEIQETKPKNYDWLLKESDVNAYYGE